MLVVLVLHVTDVQEPVSPHAEIDEHRLDARLDVDDASLVDIADEVLEAVPLDVQLFEGTVLDNGDPTLLRLEDVDQHLFFH